MSTLFLQAPYCHVVIIVSSFLHGNTSQRISALLSDLQPLECQVFSSQSEDMHAELLPMAAGISAGRQQQQQHGLEGYSHYGEFQALMRKWISREVSVAAVRLSHLHSLFLLGVV